MLKTFLPLFMMTFFICLFIVMMQFLWKYIDELVGKGLSVDLIAELFFYAALSMIPLALPLSILLASLMTFGNLGEHFELTAMKSSGISLLTVMKPLTVFIALVSVGAFFFQNDVLPQSQVKMWTLLFSMRQKSPTLDIPEGAIYSQIPGYNLYVKQKNPKNDKLYGILIYDVSISSTYPRIVAADSGSLSMTPDKTHLILSLDHGNWYEDLAAGTTLDTQLGNEMYRRESFKSKEIIIPYNDNFNRMDDETMRSQYIGKNIKELRQTIDSVNQRVDSMGNAVGREMRAMPVVGVPTSRVNFKTDGTGEIVLVKPVKMSRPVDFDSIYASMSPTARMMLLNGAISRVKMEKLENIEKLKISHPDIYDRLVNNIYKNPECSFRDKGISVIAIPSQVELVPEWITQYIDKDKIINDNVSKFYSIMESLGLSMLDTRSNSPHFSNIIQF